jgi:uncharacterized membrane protein
VNGEKRRMKQKKKPSKTLFVTIAVILCVLVTFTVPIEYGFAAFVAIIVGTIAFYKVDKREYEKSLEKKETL